ncbi:MAG: hypothetical protein ACYC0T_21745 [Ramlibacter sp.]
MERSKYQKCGNLITMKFNTAERIQDLNSEAVACAVYGLKLLKSLESVLEVIDMRDHKLDNEPEIVHGKKLCYEARDQFSSCFSYDKEEMRLLDNVVDMFPEHVGRLA